MKYLMNGFMIMSQEKMKINFLHGCLPENFHSIIHWRYSFITFQLDLALMNTLLIFLKRRLVFTCGKKIRTHINWQISLFILQFFLNYFFLKTLTLTTIKKLFNLMQSFECDTILWVNHITSFMKFHQVTTFNQFKTSEFSGVPEWKFGVTVMHQRLSRCQLLFTVFDVWLTTMFLWIRWVYYGNGSINTKNERIGSNTRIFVIRFQISKQR